MSTIHSSTYGAKALMVLYEQSNEVSNVIFQFLEQSFANSMMNCSCMVGSPPPKQMPPPVAWK